MIPDLVTFERGGEREGEGGSASKNTAMNVIWRLGQIDIMCHGLKLDQSHRVVLSRIITNMLVQEDRGPERPLRHIRVRL